MWRRGLWGDLNPKLGFLKRILLLVGCGCGEDGNDDIPPPEGGVAALTPGPMAACPLLPKGEWMMVIQYQSQEKKQWMSDVANAKVQCHGGVWQLGHNKSVICTMGCEMVL